MARRKKLKFPCMDVKLVSVDDIIANDYNPNMVALPEMRLLGISMEEDGCTQPIVTFRDPEINKYQIVDGFHRNYLIKHAFKSKVTPIVEINADLEHRMASTVRHNRARGVHRIDLMGILVEKMIKEGLTEDNIATELQMEPEEVLRLKQITGNRELFKHTNAVSSPAPRSIPEWSPVRELTFPCMDVKLIPIDMIEANDYNPNIVYATEMRLLQKSMEIDGCTMGTVAYFDPEREKYVIVDGFHRFVLIKDVFRSDVAPVAEINVDLKHRMASTVRHNRARGVHRVDLMGVLVTKMLRQGATEDEIATELEMEPEEVLRLKELNGIKELFRNRSYSKSWTVEEDVNEVKKIEL